MQPIAELAVFQLISPSGTIYDGEQITYEITLLHNGYHQATDVLLADELPDGVTFDSASDGGVYDLGTHTVTWTLASLASGSRVNRRVVAVPAEAITGTILTNVASVEADQYDPVPSAVFPANNTYTATTTVYAKAVLLLQKSAPATADVGQGLVYTLTVTNSGPSTAHSVVLTDTLPDG